jgi:hypothetical protein
LDAPILGAYIFRIFISSYWIHIFIREWPSMSLFAAFYLKYILSAISMATPTLFQIPFVWTVLFPPLHFLFVSSQVKWVSCQ